jgi:hypothetical protein
MLGVAVETFAGKEAQTKYNRLGGIIKNGQPASA